MNRNIRFLHKKITIPQEKLGLDSGATQAGKWWLFFR